MAHSNTYLEKIYKTMKNTIREQNTMRYLQFEGNASGTHEEGTGTTTTAATTTP